MHKLANIIDGVWQTDQDAVSINTTHVKSASIVEFDRWVARLSSLVVASAEFSEADLSRATNFVLAAGSMMMSRTRLQPADRTIFESSLRDAGVRRHGGY
jgi:hypothetical protein